MFLYATAVANIAATVDVKAVAETLGNRTGQSFIATDYPIYVLRGRPEHDQGCDQGVSSWTGVVVCSCSPRMHEATFRKTAAAAGLNPYMVEIANIREQCSWIHKDMPDGNRKGDRPRHVRQSQRFMLNAPLIAGESPVTKRALVIGGGIAGIQTALDIAEAGYRGRHCRKGTDHRR